VTVVTAIIEATVQHSYTALRVIRSLRIVCVFRILNHVRGLQILMLAFFKTITEWVAPAILLLLIIMYIFAIISDHYFQSEDVWWGTIGRCLMSLISYFTVSKVDSVALLLLILNKQFVLAQLAEFLRRAAKLSLQAYAIRHIRLSLCLSATFRYSSLYFANK